MENSNANNMTFEEQVAKVLKAKKRMPFFQNEFNEYIKSYISNTYKVKTLYHYTNIEALVKGILVHDPKDDSEAISLFATDYRYLNDILEMKIGTKRLMKKYFNIDGDMEKIIQQAEDVPIGNYYIISFSNAKDSIPMWSTYGRSGNGIALEFDASILLETLGFVYPCIYEEQDINKLLHIPKDFANLPEYAEYDFAYQFLYMEWIYDRCMKTSKHESFFYEKEFRFVGIKNDDDKLEFNYSNNLIIPHIVKYLPKKALKSIMIGPNLDNERTELSIREYIDSLGFTDVIINHSKVPFRQL